MISDSHITHRGLCPQAVRPSPGGSRKSRFDDFCTSLLNLDFTEKAHGSSIRKNSTLSKSLLLYSWETYSPSTTWNERADYAWYWKKSARGIFDIILNRVFVKFFQIMYFNLNYIQISADLFTLRPISIILLNSNNLQQTDLVSLIFFRNFAVPAHVEGSFDTYIGRGDILQGVICAFVLTL